MDPMGYRIAHFAEISQGKEINILLPKTKNRTSKLGQPARGVSV